MILVSGFCKKYKIPYEILDLIYKKIRGVLKCDFKCYMHCHHIIVDKYTHFIETDNEKYIKEYYAFDVDKWSSTFCTLQNTFKLNQIHELQIKILKTNEKSLSLTKRFGIGIGSLEDSNRTIKKKWDALFRKRLSRWCLDGYLFQNSYQLYASPIGIYVYHSKYGDLCTRKKIMTFNQPLKINDEISFVLDLKNITPNIMFKINNKEVYSYFIDSYNKNFYPFVSTSCFGAKFQILKCY